MKYTIAFILNIMMGTSLLVASGAISPLDPRIPHEEEPINNPSDEGNKDDERNKENESPIKIDKQG